MKNDSQLQGNVSVRKAIILLSALMLCTLAACSQTVQGTPAVAQEMQSGNVPPSVSQFFGSDVALLQPGKEGQASMVYINPNVRWSQYTKILLQPVQYWDTADSKMPTHDEQVLITYFYNTLKNNLEKNFTIVDQPGPDVIVLYVAVMNYTTATPVLRSVSVVVPQARILNSLQSVATGSYAFAGSAEAEMKALDGSTGEFFAGAIDRRSGGVAMSAAAQWQLGDAENAMNYWAERIDTRLLQLQGRAPTSQQSSRRREEPGQKLASN